MISSVNGNLVEINPAFAVIECNGIGYMFYISLNTYSKINKLEACKLFIEQVYLRDDLPRFYGFFEKSERLLFQKLISVSGVGGSSAIMMLSSMSSSEIQDAILTANVSTLKSIKGIGEKTAQRIIVDLKGKFGKDDMQFENIMNMGNKTKDEALSALVMLGFSKAPAEKVLEKLIQSSDKDLSVEDLIKSALKNL